MVRRSPLILAALLILAWGCSLVDLVGLEPRTPAASVQLTLVENDSVWLEVRVHMAAGIDAQGKPNPVPDPALYIENIKVNSSMVSPPDGYSYELVLGPSSIPASSAGLSLRLPPILNYQGTEVVLPVRLRAGSKCRFVASGQRLARGGAGWIRTRRFRTGELASRAGAIVQHVRFSHTHGQQRVA